jgi:hypothetical protein
LNYGTPKHGGNTSAIRISHPFQLVLWISSLALLVLWISLTKWRLFWMQMILAMEVSETDLKGFSLFKKRTLSFDVLTS